MADDAEIWRERLIETVSENDDEAMEASSPVRSSPWSSSTPPSVARPSPASSTLSSVFCVQEQGRAADAGRGGGVPAVAAGHRGHPRHAAGRGHPGRAPAERDEPFSGLAFKVATDPHLGKLTYVRVYSGKLISGTQVVNATKDRKERIGKIYQMHANKREELASVGAGDICAVMGLKQTTTGDTLADPAKPIVLESMTFPDPVISVAIEPKTKVDQEKLGTAIQKLAEEDPTFKVKNDEETGQTVISGMGELHLDILVDRMKREFSVEANIGKPQVAYRETIRGTVEKYGYTHKKQTGGSGQFAKILITVEPLDMTAPDSRRDVRVRQRASPVVVSRRSTSLRSTPVRRTRCSTASWPGTRCSGSS